MKSGKKGLPRAKLAPSRIEGPRGSALIIALLLMAAVGSVAFGIGRLFMLESSIAGIYENSAIAYYSAESGIEEGFLRYRYNRSAEVPIPYQSGKAFRTNIATSDVSNSSITLASNPVQNLSQQIYDLDMKVYENYYGDDRNYNGSLEVADLKDNSYATVYKVPYDESQKVDISTAISPSGDVNLLFRRFGGECQGGFKESDAFIEIKLTGYISGSLEEVKAAAVTPGSRSRGGEIVAVKDTSAGAAVYYLNNLLSSIYTQTGALTSFDRSKAVALTIKPLVCPVSIGINPSLSNKKIASAFSTVESRGYYGGVGRLLKARIDRQAGTLYDLFDYVILDTE